MTTTHVDWWRHAAVYQVYPRSFADANGDGTGDVNGIRSRLDYLADLGVDAIWISPWYPSPLHDGGYDVANYRDIDPRFGSLSDAEELIAEAHERGIRIIVDLVPNHTSSEHPWFREALAATPGSPERNRYIFRPGAGKDGSEPPNNWQSVFGGSAWTRVHSDDGEWYLHLFDVSQPDLNWENEEVRAEFDSIFEFWLDRGVDGFRVDVAHSLIKDRNFPDLDEAQEVLGATPPPNHPHWDRDGVHDIIRRWRAILDAHEAATGRSVMMVAEAWVHPDSLPNYLRPDEYHQSFNFDLLNSPWEPDHIRSVIDSAITAAAAVGSASTWTWSNHDVMRHATRLALPGEVNWRMWPMTGPADLLDPAIGLRRARAASMLLLALPGSAYIYQGEELGLPDVWDLPPEVLDDPVWKRSQHTQKGRDGCRVPIPWTTTGPSFGFGDGPGWLPQPAEYGSLAAQAQAGVTGSTLELYRSMLQLRRQYLTVDEELTWRSDIGGGEVVAFERGSGVVSITNFGPDPVGLPNGTVLAASDGLVDDLLPTDTTVWVLAD